MAKAKKTKKTETDTEKRTFEAFTFWIVGTTPLITHSWSMKAKSEMLSKQRKEVRGRGRSERDPQEDFTNSLYEMSDGVYGFPVTGIKNALVSAAHKERGIAKTSVQSSLWLHAEMVRVQPAMAGAICDMPLVRIWGDAPVMREDMVRIGSGLKKTANLAYRGQFTRWAVNLRGRYNTAGLTSDQLAFLVAEAGFGWGIGEWRNERRGMFGAFHLATPHEAKAWDAFAQGNGPMPEPVDPFEMPMPVAADD